MVPLCSAACRGMVLRIVSLCWSTARQQLYNRSHPKHQDQHTFLLHLVRFSERDTMSGRFLFSLLTFTASTVASMSDSPSSLFGRESNLSSRGLLPNEEPAIRVLTKRAPCSPGQYYTTRCRTCTAGYSCPDGQNRVSCGAGAYSAPGATQCTLCPYGTYSGSEYYTL